MAEVGRKPWTPGKPSIANIHCDGLTLLHVADVLVVLLVTGSPLALKFNVKATAATPDTNPFLRMHNWCQTDGAV